MEYSRESSREDEKGKYTTSITVQADEERFMASMQIHRERLQELYQDTQEAKGMDEHAYQIETVNVKLSPDVPEHWDVTYGHVLLQTAVEIVDVMSKHRIRRREVAEVMQAVQEILDSQSVMEPKHYPNSR